MGKICWDFPFLGNGNLTGDNIAAITMFKGSGVMDGLVREVCQNSLDAKDPDLDVDTPVKVHIGLSYLDKNAFPVFAEYEEAVDNAEKYWAQNPLCTDGIRAFLSNNKEALNNKKIPLLVLSDYNTTGLNGINAGPGEKSYWKLLVDTDGISIKPDKTSAGSFGIGKNAPYAYSAFNMIFYNTLAKDGGVAFEGVTRFVTTQKERNGEMFETQPIGKYLYLVDDIKGRPILPEDNCTLAQIAAFARKETGTDIGVVGFKEGEYPDWEKTMAVSFIKNFILAIINGKIELLIESEELSYNVTKETIETYLFDVFSDEQQLKYTRQIYETYLRGERTDVKIVEDGDLSIFVRYDDKYTQSLSRFRATGMLINTTSESLPHYSVVIVANNVGNNVLSTTLLKAEPPEHTEWNAKNITDNRTLHNQAAKFIRTIGKEIQNVLNNFEQADITDQMDAGIGNYLPDAADTGGVSDNPDDLRTITTVKEISSYQGEVFFKKDYITATGATGEKTDQSGVKIGPPKHRKRRKKLPVVFPGNGDTKGVTAGEGKVIIATPEFIDHRLYYMAANKYRLFVDSPCDYEKIYVQCFAGRDDNKEDSLTIKNVKLEDAPRFDINSEKLGPISIKKGANTLYLEFNEHEIMAINPVFTMEVAHEE